MKIVLVSYHYWPPDFGGELLVAIKRFQSMVARGHEVLVLTSGKVGYASAEDQDNIHIRRSPIIHDSRPGKALRRLVFALLVMLRLATMPKYDVVHMGTLPGIDPSTSMLLGWIFGRIARLRGSRTVHVHSLADTEERSLDLTNLTGKLKYRYLKAMTSIVGVSPALYESVKEVFPDRAVLLPYGVEEERFKPPTPEKRQETRQSLNATKDEVIFSFLGSVNSRKGFDLLSQAFANLNQQHPDWKLLVIGPYTRKESQNIIPEEVEAVTAPVKGNDQVIFYGRVDDRELLADLIGSSDIFVFPSRREGMGIAPMEAMATGVPAIIARIPDVTDLASIDGETGLYIDVDDMQGLQQAMEKLALDDALRQRMGKAARQRITSAFGWEQYADQWESIYATGSTKDLH